MSNLAFAIQKSSAAIVEGIAIEKIQQWYAAQGLRIHARYNEANGLTEKRGYDLIDSYGRRWEVKADRLAGTTGNFFLEHVALEHSQADMFIIFACGQTFIVPRQTLLDAISGPYRAVQGGDDFRATGTLLPLSELSLIATIV